MRAKHLANDRGRELPPVVLTDHLAVAAWKEPVHFDLILPHPIGCRLEAERPCHFASKPEAGAARRKRVVLRGSQEPDQAVR